MFYKLGWILPVEGADEVGKSAAGYEMASGCVSLEPRLVVLILRFFLFSFPFRSSRGECGLGCCFDIASLFNTR